MTDHLALVDKIFDLALAGSDADIAERRDVLWTAGITLIADVLLRASPLEREQLLMGIELELRRALRDMPFAACPRRRFPNSSFD
jgi:hypothetical protein